MNVKNLFISDVHLGCPFSSTSELLQFLDYVQENSPPEKLYIVGDFIDGWKLRRNWFWNDQANLVIRKILGFIRRNTTIYYIAGNHDDFMRSLFDSFHLMDFGSIHIGDEFIHETANGRKMLVTHGDHFDLVTKYARWLCWIGDMGYEVMLRLNRIVNWARRSMRLPYWSLSAAVKNQVKNAVKYISDFSKCLTQYAIAKGCNGCVCGHIHHAELKMQPENFLYANTGDWVESCTALYEDHDGNFHIYRHHDAGV